jgi:hypothetical protein
MLNVGVLAARATARRLFREQIEESSSDSFKLDFNGIEFASRSFMDELNLLIKDHSYRVHKINMNSQVQQMDELVQKTDKEKSRPKNSNASSADVVTL